MKKSLFSYGVELPKIINEDSNAIEDSLGDDGFKSNTNYASTNDHDTENDENDENDDNDSQIVEC